MSSPLQRSITEYIDAQGGGDGLFVTAINGLTLMRSVRSNLPNHLIYRPELCVVVQGAKSIMIGDVTMEYRAMQALVASVEVPGIGNVVEATPDKPLLVLALELDVGLLRETMNQLAAAPPSMLENGLGVYVLDVGEQLEKCLLRLVEMLGSPQEIAVLLPLLLREIYFRLLSGPQGEKLRMLGLPDSRARRVTDALYVLRADFTRPVRIQELADAAGMSISSFHFHFKQLTAMSPLKYQKHLRLLEAKRLMVTEDANVTRAAFHVGYESASQFSREYVRLFGAPPRRDAMAARTLYRIHAAPSA